MIIYLITNKINGKQYIGQTVRTLEERWRSHCYGNSGCLAIKSAIDKYGKENFSAECLFETNIPEELDQKEIEFINRFNTLAPNGYNLKTGGNRPTYSEESRKKMSDSGKKRKPASKESNRKGAISRSGPNNCNYGKIFTKEHREKISKANRGNNSRTKIPVLCIENGIIYPSISHAAKALNIDSGHIYQILTGRCKVAKGYTFCKVL